jgi:hypothetical protein
LELRNYITQSEAYASYIQEEQHSLGTSLSELQAEFQRFRADMEARTEQADNSATLQAENRQLRDQLATVSNPTLSDLVGPSSTALENPGNAVNPQTRATTLPLLSVSDMLKHYEAAIRSELSLVISRTIRISYMTSEGGSTTGKPNSATPVLPYLVAYTSTLFNDG